MEGVCKLLECDIGQRAMWAHLVVFVPQGFEGPRVSRGAGPRWIVGLKRLIRAS